MTTARCTDYPQLNWFATDEHGQQQAAAICHGCAIREACEAGARARGEQYGIWAGLNAEMGWLPVEAPAADVMVVAEPARIRVTVAAVHGNRGTYLHCTAGEDGGKCADCRRANTRYIAGYRNDGPAVTRERTIDLQIPLFEGVPA